MDVGSHHSALTHEEIQQKLSPADTFVDFEHGINAAVKRQREALDDTADNPRFVESLARRSDFPASSPTD